MGTMIILAAFFVCTIGSCLIYFLCRWGAKRGARVLVPLTAVALGAYAFIIFFRAVGFAIADVAVLGVSVLLGSTFALMFRTKAGLVSFCITASIADVFSSQSGATARLSRSFQSGESNLLEYLCLSLPLGGKMQPIIGIGDLIILATIYSAFHRLGHKGVLPFAAPLAGVYLALAVGLMVGGVFAIPFIAATTIFYLWFVQKRSSTLKSAQ